MASCIFKNENGECCVPPGESYGPPCSLEGSGSPERCDVYRLYRDDALRLRVVQLALADLAREDLKLWKCPRCGTKHDRSLWACPTCSKMCGYFFLIPFAAACVFFSVAPGICSAGFSRYALMVPGVFFLIPVAIALWQSAEGRFSWGRNLRASSKARLRCRNCGHLQDKGDWEAEMETRARASGARGFVNLSASPQCLKCTSSDLVDVSQPQADEVAAGPTVLRTQASGVCDICKQAASTGTGAKVFTARDMRAATDRGFNGMAAGPNARMLSMVGVTAAETHREWKRKVDLNASDWLLCPDCQAEISKYVKT